MDSTIKERTIQLGFGLEKIEDALVQTVHTALQDKSLVTQSGGANLSLVAENFTTNDPTRNGTAIN